MPTNLARTPVRLCLAVLILAVSAATARAQDPQPQQQREHTVRPGDTLWDLARAYFQDPFKWRLIAEANTGVVENPHWIYPRERLIIPTLLRRTAAVPLGTPVDLLEPAPQPVIEPQPVEPPAAAVSIDLRQPIVRASEYQAAPWLSPTVDQITTGRIARLTDPAASADRLVPALYPQDRVIIEGAAGSAGDSLLVVRIGRRINGVGYVIEPLGVLAVEESGAGVMIARMVRQFADARVGDAVMPLPALPQIGVGDPEPVSAGVEGHLVQFLVDEPLHGTTDIAFVSLGRASGVGIGDELGVYVPAADPSLAPERVATVRVVRADEGTATVRVLSTNSTALRDGLPVRLIRRMP